MGEKKFELVKCHKEERNELQPSRTKEPRSYP